MWKKVTGNKIICAARHLKHSVINLNYFCVWAGEGGSVSSTSARAECFCAADVLSMPADISPLSATPGIYTGGNKHKLMSLTSSTSSATFGDLMEPLLFTQCLKATSSRWRCLVDPTTCEITCAPLSFSWIIVRSSQKKQHNRWHWKFEICWLWLFDYYSASSVRDELHSQPRVSLFAGDFDLTALLIPRWIGNSAA